MKIWKFSSLEVAQEESERVTEEMGLKPPLYAFNVYEDEQNGVHTYSDKLIDKYINKDLVIEIEIENEL